MIGKLNVYHRVVHNSYRFPEQYLLNELAEQKNKLELSIKKHNIDDPIILRKVRKFQLILDFMTNFDLQTLYDTYMKVFYKYSKLVGKETTLCKHSSFDPKFYHITPYYTRNEIINMALNLEIDVPDKYLEQEDIVKLCNIVKENEISSNILIEHQQHIVKNNYVGLVQYYTLQGSYFMNQYLRNLVDYKFRNEYLEGLIKPMWNIVLQAPEFDKSYVFYRFIHNDEFLKNIKIGDTYTENGFMSTTRDPFYRTDLYQFGFILIKIKVPKKIKGVALCLELISHFSEEQEIIFPPNATFKLVKKDESITYHHTNINITSKVKIRYEFEWISNDSPTFKLRSDPIEKTNTINFLELNKINSITIDEKIKQFINKNVNSMSQFKVLIGDIEFIATIEQYDGTNAYKEFYALEIKNGFSIYTIYKGYVLFFIELGETDNGYEMHVNYYVKYSALDTEKIMGDQNFIKFISSIAYYFGISTVVLYANYLPCNYKIIQHAGAKQRNYSKEINNDNINIKINNINDIDNIYDNYIGGNYCLDLYRYLKEGYKRYENSNILNVELRPEFSYYYLDILKDKNAKEILNREDQDECYQIFHKSYKLSNSNQSVAAFYIWLKRNKCYLLEHFVKKINRILGKNNPFEYDTYILDASTFLYNRKLISYYPTYSSIDVVSKKYIKNKNEYRNEIAPRIKCRK